jgi:hypothetical protein
LIWLVLVAVTAMLTNQALFVHSHRLADGTTVTHAHPYQPANDSNAPFKTHHHSKIEFLAFDNISHFILVFFMVNFALFKTKLLKIEKPVSFISIPSDFSHPALRAPPQTF